MSLTASRSAAVALTSAAFMALSAIAIPAAAGADAPTCDPADVTYSVTGGSIEWGFKQSFRSYFFDPATHGTFTPTGGVEMAGDQQGATGRMIWPLGSGTATSASAVTASGTGSANFSAHGGAMNTTLSNPTVGITGTEGVLKFDFTGKARAGGDVSATQAEAANFTLPEAANFQTAGSVTVTGTATLDQQFVPAFGYAAGDEVDPVTVNLTLAQTCGDDGDNDNDNPNEGEIPGDDNGGIFGSIARLFSFGS